MSSDGRALWLGCALWLGVGGAFCAHGAEVSREAVVAQNAAIAFAVYSDSAETAKALQAAVDTLVEAPTEAHLAAAREAWLAAREPYGQSEVYRFRNGPIDALTVAGEMIPGEGREGYINAWPLDEALIDYVVEVDGNARNEDQPVTSLIADERFEITPANLNAMNELGENEANVATGYHAIEFLLWGQDLNGDRAPHDGRRRRDDTPGQRPVTDYRADADCTSGAESSPAAICERRGQYLRAAAALLVEDLTRIAAAWDPDGGAHYQRFTAGEDEGRALLKILIGMGSLSYGELAGERILVALAANSQEDEHSCFADNTHRDIYLNALGIQNSYLGRYTRVDGAEVTGPGIDALLRAQGHTELADRLKAQLAATMEAAQVIVDKAEQGMPFDRLIEQYPGEDKDGRPILNANMANNILVNDVVVALQRQTRTIEDAIAALFGEGIDYDIEDSPAFAGG
ncbi:MAG: imelysin family protein [Candidatus Competibacterales bacterium]